MTPKANNDNVFITSNDNIVESNLPEIPKIVNKDLTIANNYNFRDRVEVIRKIEDASSDANQIIKDTLPGSDIKVFTEFSSFKKITEAPSYIKKQMKHHPLDVYNFAGKISEASIRSSIRDAFEVDDVSELPSKLDLKPRQRPNTCTFRS